MFLKTIKEGNLEHVKQLIREGADVNSKDNRGATALITATLNGNLEIVKELLKNGADINATDSAGRTALLVAMSKCDSARVKHMVIPVNTDIVNVLLKNGAYINVADNYGYTPLMLASYSGNLELVKEFLRFGADVNLKNRYGDTALILAAGQGYAFHENAFQKDNLENIHINILEALIKNGADINVKNNIGRTALSYQFHWGIEESNKGIVKTLIKNGADVLYLINDIDSNPPSPNCKGLQVLDYILKNQVQDKDYQVAKKCLETLYIYLDSSYENVCSKLESTLKNPIQNKDYELLEKCLDTFYMYLDTAYKTINDENVAHIFDKLDKVTTIMGNLLNSEIIIQQKREKQELKKHIKELTNCSEKDELCTLIANIPQDIIGLLTGDRNNSIVLQPNTDVFMVRNELLAALKMEVNKIEKVFEAIHKFETKIDLDHKHLILGGINMRGKNTTNNMELD